MVRVGGGLSFLIPLGKLSYLVAGDKRPRG